jgi:hypothetical protein
MMWLYVLLVAVVLAALPLTWWLKRAGDRAWEQRRREQRMRELLKPTSDAFLLFQIQLVDLMTPALQQLGREVDRMADDFRRAANSPAMRQFVRDINRIERGGRA